MCVMVPIWRSEDDLSYWSLFSPLVEALLVGCYHVCQASGLMFPGILIFSHLNIGHWDYSCVSLCPDSHGHRVKSSWMNGKWLTY